MPNIWNWIICGFWKLPAAKSQHFQYFAEPFIWSSIYRLSLVPRVFWRIVRTVCPESCKFYWDKLENCSNLTVGEFCYCFILRECAGVWYLLSCTRSSIRLLLEFSKCGGAAARCNETKFHKGCILQFLTIAKERYISHWVGESCAIKRDKTSRAGIPGLKQRSGTLNFTYSPAKPLNFYSYLTSLDRRIISFIFINDLHWNE